MKKCCSLLLFPFMMACSLPTQISYIGNSFEPTQRVDVFVDESAVTSPYKIIGKGYVKMYPFSNVE